MNYLSVFSDIHANLLALLAVLDDQDRRGLENRYCLGDLVGYGTFPNEVVELIKERNIPTIMGNYDQGVGNSSDECGCAYKTDWEEALGKRSIAWSNLKTFEENKAFLRSLPAQISLQLGDLRVLLAHGSPRKINEYLYEDRPDASLERILDSVNVDVLVVGHTHKPYHKVLPSGRHVINDGSVGKPKDGDVRAAYVILEAEGKDLKVEFVRVPYDVEQVATAIEISDMPAEYANMLRTASG
jgi:putative phosphoesterase